MIKGTVTISTADYHNLLDIQAAMENKVIPCRTSRGGCFYFYTKSKAVKEIAAINEELRVQMGEFSNQLKALADQYETSKKKHEKNPFYALMRNFSFFRHGCLP